MLKVYWFLALRVSLIAEEDKLSLNESNPLYQKSVSIEESEVAKSVIV